MKTFKAILYSILNQRMFWITWIEEDNGDDLYPKVRHWLNVLTGDRACNRVPLDESSSFKFIMKHYYDENI